jgi:hypothetical protein
MSVRASKSVPDLFTENWNQLQPILSKIKMPEFSFQRHEIPKSLENRNVDLNLIFFGACN